MPAVECVRGVKCVKRGTLDNQYEGFLDTVSMNIQYLNIEARFKGPGLLAK